MIIRSWRRRTSRFSSRSPGNARLNDLLDLEPTLHDPVVQSGQSDPLVVQALHPVPQLGQFT
ncbi:hypothetical protein [Streptomyces fradiae]|uniref:hypothetical protein n=1 Tax=Streptomyces fradiae TaxID=1906 RepID=UPI003987E997